MYIYILIYFNTTSLSRYIMPATDVKYHDNVLVLKESLRQRDCNH